MATTTFSKSSDLAQDLTADSAFQLVDLTHRERSSWDIVADHGRNMDYAKKIPDDTIEKYYSTLLSR